MTIGILGPPSRSDFLSVFDNWAEVSWGVDSVADVLDRVAVNPIDLLVTDASIMFLTDEILHLVPHTVKQIVAVAESDGVFEWAAQLDGVSAVRNFSDIANSVRPQPEISAGSDDSLTGNQVLQIVRTGRVIAVWGPIGSPGVTTTAISLATVSASAGLSTLLCDVDTRGSSVAIALGLVDEAPGFASACRLAARNELTASELRRVMSRFARKDVSFEVLTGIPRATRWAEISPEKARIVLAMARSLFDTVIVDVGFGIEENEWIDDAPQRDGCARDIVRSVDSVVAVGRSDAVGLSRLIRGLDEIRDLCPAPLVVLNAVPSTSGGDATDALRRFSGHEVRSIVPKDSRGGLEDAMPRARQSPNIWRKILSEAGVIVPVARVSRWRR
jgi:MinD-like ATPase involved in chromosome partitioning or flagellar assembly